MAQKLRPNEKLDFHPAQPVPSKYRKDLTAVTMNDMNDFRTSNH